MLTMREKSFSFTFFSQDNLKPPIPGELTFHTTRQACQKKKYDRRINDPMHEKIMPESNKKLHMILIKKGEDDDISDTTYK